MELIRKVLSPAVRLWLRSQVDSAQSLDFRLEGRDGQLLSGQIPQVWVRGDQVVYQGLCLSQLDITGQGIHINLKQILRGKPLQLLEPIRVQATLRMADGDMNQCLQAPLLAKALTEVLDQWLQPLEAWVEPGGGEPGDPALGSHWQEVRMEFLADALHLWATLIRSGGVDPLRVELRSPVTLQDPHTIILAPLQWITSDAEATAALGSLEHLVLNLGQDVAFDRLTLEPGTIICQGDLIIRP